MFNYKVDYSVIRTMLQYSLDIEQFDKLLLNLLLIPNELYKEMIQNFLANDNAKIVAMLIPIIRHNKK
jgi:hypothetical protein